MKRCIKLKKERFEKTELKVCIRNIYTGLNEENYFLKNLVVL